MSEARYPDLHQHLDELARRGRLQVIDRPIDKDSELHPLVRWQFVGGMAEAERKAFLFTRVVNAQGRKYAFPVVVGALAVVNAFGDVTDGAGTILAGARDPDGGFASPLGEERHGAERVAEDVASNKGDLV